MDGRFYMTLNQTNCDCLLYMSITPVPGTQLTQKRSTGRARTSSRDTQSGKYEAEQTEQLLTEKMRRSLKSGKHVKLVGYILPPKSDHGAAESEDDEEEEETPPEFLDMNEMDAVSSGGFLFQQSIPAADEVDFMFNGKKVRVGGRFPLRNPWWEISCSAQQYARKLVVNGYPAYNLRTDLKHDVISLFLKECDVDDTFVMQFIKWLPKNRTVNLQNLEEALREFGKSSEESVSDYVRTQISNSDAAFYVKAATTYPYVMKHLPTLLPGQFLNLLKKGKEQEEKKDKQSAKNEEESMADSPQKYNTVSLLARLEELIKTEVWKFGFGYIMYKELRLVRCETTLKNFESSVLYSNLSLVQQNALKVYNTLKVYCRKFGHTYMEQKLLDKWAEMPEVSTWEAVAFLRQNGVLNVEKEKIALTNLYNYEKDIADSLHKVIAGEPWKIDLDVREVLLAADRERRRDQLATNSCSSASGTNGKENQSAPSRESTSDIHSPMKEIPETISDAGLMLDPDQVRAAEMMCTNPVTVISGKGGCGKTTVVSMIFKAAMKQQKKNREDNDRILKDGEQKENDDEPMEVLLTAPTGRAAALLTNKTCFTASTMHQVLWSYRIAKKDESLLKWKFNKVRVLVVDEGSLVCVQILSSILTILTTHAQLQKFIILGDIRQFPSIEPGNVLNDLFTSLKKVNWAIEMRTNHRAESKLIVENASLIADMGAIKKFHHLSYDATVELDKTFKLPSPEKSFIEILFPEKENDDDLQNSIKRLLEGPAPGLEDDVSSQFIAFKRDECALINELCCKHYSNHTTKTHRNKMNFQIGDKVCCTRNGYVSDKDKQDNAKDKGDDLDESKIIKDRLCNGEIFFITQDVTTEDVGRKRNKLRYLTLDNKQGKKLTVEYRELMRECKLQHAWARTIHTFQGSEQKTIVYVLDYVKHQTWKHVYTAVTRGQSRVYIIAKQDSLKKAIQGHVVRRNTRLEGHVMDMLHELGRTNADFLIQASQFQFNTPKRGCSQSAHEPSSSPGLSQACPEMMSSKNAHLESQPNAGNWFGGFSSPMSKSPSMCKRERIADNCTSASKIIKVDTPLGSSQLQQLPLNVTPRQLFTEAPQSHQDQ